MNVLIYGAGAVGLGIASCLIEAGVSVSIVARARIADAVTQNGIRRTGIFGERYHTPDSVRAADTLDPFLAETFDCILVCTKSFDSDHAGHDLKRLYDRSGDDPISILFQNGWGNTEAFARHIPTDLVFNARVITGFALTGASDVDITVHADDIHIGHLEGSRDARVDRLCASICAGGVPCSTTTDIAADLWSKMLYNCSLNSLGAIFEMSYGELADNPRTRELLDRIIGECFRVMRQSGFSTHWDSAHEYLDAFYKSMVPATRAHYPSTLQDIRAGKRTEIDALNGAVIALAERAEVDAPYNRFAYIMVKHKESQGAQ